MSTTSPQAHAASLPTYCRLNPHETCCVSDPCGTRQLARFNSGVGELNYIQLLIRHVRIAMPGFAPRFVVDTSRNGVESNRVDCDHACNLRAAGLGPLPTSRTALPTLVDAYFWVHPPGISDGCGARAHTEPVSSHSRSCARAEQACAQDDALGARSQEDDAPAAGELYLPLLRQLAARAGGDGAYGTAVGSPALVDAAAGAAALAAQMGVPAEWARGIVKPRRTIEAARDTTTGGGTGAQSSGLWLALCAAVAAAAVAGFVLQQLRVATGQRARAMQDDESELLSVAMTDAVKARNNVPAQQNSSHQRKLQLREAVSEEATEHAPPSTSLEAVGALLAEREPIEFRCVD